MIDSIESKVNQNFHELSELGVLREKSMDESMLAMNE